MLMSRSYSTLSQKDGKPIRLLVVLQNSEPANGTMNPNFFLVVAHNHDRMTNGTIQLVGNSLIVSVVLLFD